jgi:hypothetical protein
LFLFSFFFFSSFSRFVRLQAQLVSAMASSEVSGFLQKKGGVDGKAGWKKRFFTLRNAASTVTAPMFSFVSHCVQKK